jgi:hypothetical protein
MSVIQVTAERQNSPYPAITVDYDIGDSLNQLVSQYGEPVVYIHARRSIYQSLQNYLRGWIDKAIDQQIPYELLVEEVNKGMKTWAPGKRRTMTDREKAQQLLDKLSPAERAAVFREHEAQLRRQMHGDSHPQSG